MKKLILIPILIFIFMLSFFCAYTLSKNRLFYPSLRYIMGKLDSYLETEYKYISTYKDGEPNIEGIKIVIFEFEDINGIPFHVITFPFFGDYDSSQPGYPRCNYLAAYYDCNKESIEKVLRHSGVPVNFNSNGTYSFRLEVSDYDELTLIAPAIKEAMNMFEPLISEKYLGKASDKFEFNIPGISVCTADNIAISFFEFRILKGENPLTEAEILDKLQRDYSSSQFVN